MRNRDIFGFVPVSETGFHSATGGWPKCKCVGCDSDLPPEECAMCCEGTSPFGTGKRDSGGFYIGAKTSQPYVGASGGRMCACAGCGHINIDADPYTGMGQLACARCCKGQQSGFRGASGVMPCREHGFTRCSGRGTFMECRNRCTSKPSPRSRQFKRACGCGA